MMTPIEVSDVLMVFPGDVAGLIPAEKDIPEAYWESDGSWPCRLFNDLFFKGVRNIKLHPKDDIDPELAWRHIRAIMGSFQPKHEHKEAACRYLFDSWFADATWECG